MNVLALARAAKEDPSLVATREELSRQLAGNLCRCSGYESQLRAHRALPQRVRRAGGL